MLMHENQYLISLLITLEEIFVEMSVLSIESPSGLTACTVCLSL